MLLRDTTSCRVFEAHIKDAGLEDVLLSGRLQLSTTFLTSYLRNWGSTMRKAQWRLSAAGLVCCLLRAASWLRLLTVTFVNKMPVASNHRCHVGQGTSAAQKLPEDWEQQGEMAAARMAYVVKLYDIPPDLLYNADQNGHTLRAECRYASAKEMLHGETCVAASQTA